MGQAGTRWPARLGRTGGSFPTLAGRRSCLQVLFPGQVRDRPPASDRAVTIRHHSTPLQGRGDELAGCSKRRSQMLWAVAPRTVSVWELTQRNVRVNSALEKVLEWEHKVW